MRVRERERERETEEEEERRTCTREAVTVPTAHTWCWFGGWAWRRRIKLLHVTALTHRGVLSSPHAIASEATRPQQCVAHLRGQRCAEQQHARLASKDAAPAVHHSCVVPTPAHTHTSRAPHRHACPADEAEGALVV
jgi:hypothetical protein